MKKLESQNKQDSIKSDASHKTSSSIDVVKNIAGSMPTIPAVVQNIQTQAKEATQAMRGMVDARIVKSENDRLRVQVKALKKLLEQQQSGDVMIQGYLMVRNDNILMTMFGAIYERKYVTVYGQHLLLYRSERDTVFFPDIRYRLKQSRVRWEGHKEGYWVLHIVDESQGHLVRLGCPSREVAVEWCVGMAVAGCLFRSLPSDVYNTVKTNSGNSFDDDGSSCSTPRSDGEQSKPTSSEAATQEGQSQKQHTPRKRDKRELMVASTPLHTQGSASYLSSERILYQQYSGVLNLVLIILFTYTLRTVYDNWSKYGMMYRPQRYGMQFWLLVTTHPIFVTVLALHLPLFFAIAYGIEKFAAILMDKDIKATIALNKRAADAVPADSLPPHPYGMQYKLPGSQSSQSGFSTLKPSSDVQQDGDVSSGIEEEEFTTPREDMLRKGSTGQSVGQDGGPVGQALGSDSQEEGQPLLKQRLLQQQQQWQQQGSVGVQEEKVAQSQQEQQAHQRQQKQRAHSAPAWEWVIWALNFTNCCMSTTLPLMMVARYRSHILPDIFISALSIITFMKLLSYAHCNADLRKARRQHKLRVGERGHAALSQLPGLTPRLQYPENLTVSNFAYFIFAPTLIYQMEYPRNQRIRGYFLLRRFFELLFFLNILMFVIDQFLEPAVKNSLLAMHKRDMLAVVYRVLAISTPCVYTWLVGFYLVFQVMLNISAELLRFSDREFYRGWWNATTIGDYWRLWNIPVHKWMLRHVYLPVQNVTGNRFLAMVSTFVVSAAAHELVMAVPLGSAAGWAFFGMLLQIPLVYISQEMHRELKNDYYGNLFFWVTFCATGQPFLLLQYYYGYVIKFMPEQLMEQLAKGDTWAARNTTAHA